jgi:putative ABC transport system substrate-binding protein
MLHMSRREFITLLGGAAVAWPLSARAQQSTMPVIGYLGSESPDAFAGRLRAFRQGLSEAGYVEGKNLAVEYRWAENQYDRFPALLADLVRREVTVIVAVTGTPPVFAAKAATTTIPIVFVTAADPVALGLVASLNRPGGNLTGVNSMNVELGAKRLGLLHELVPGAAPFALLVNPNYPAAASVITDVRAAAATVGRPIEVLTAGTNRDIDTAFASLVQKRADALLVSPNPLFFSRRVQIVTLAARHAVPAIYFAREFTDVGGLMSYGTNLLDQDRQVGLYAGRILKGEKPADLPVMRATRFEFIINLQTAKILGIDIPPALLAQADEVIE